MESYKRSKNALHIDNLDTTEDAESIVTSIDEMTESKPLGKSMYPQRNQNYSPQQKQQVTWEPK